MSWIVFLNNRDMKMSAPFNTAYDLTIGHQLSVLKKLLFMLGGNNVIHNGKCLIFDEAGNNTNK